MMENLTPFGFRVFIKVDNDTLENIGGDLKTGIVYKMPAINESYLDIIKDFDIQTLLYHQFITQCKTGTKVKFNYKKEVINFNDNIYNVPIELIRSYNNEE